MSTCTYCGKELSGLKHIKKLRPFYAIDPDEKEAAAIVNAVGMAVIAAADLNVTPETVEANDPLKMATISELKEKYESEIQVK